MLRVLLSTAIVILILTSFGQAQTALTAGDVNGASGSSVVVPISISDGQGVSALQFTLEFDSAVLSIAEDPPLLGNAVVDHVVAANTQEGRITFVIFSATLSSFRTGPGSVVSVILEVNSDAGDGLVIPLSLIEVEGADSDGIFVNVLGIDGSIQVGDAGNVPAVGENELIFPQIANGGFNGGSIAALLVFVNRTKTTSNGRVSFFKSDGTPFFLKLTDDQDDSAFDFSVSPNGSVVLVTDGSGDLSAGYARLTATAPLGGTVIFTTRDPSGTPLTEAGVGASPVGQRFSVPVLFDQAGSDTGIALANVSDQEIELTLILRDEFGNELDRISIMLGLGEHLARFASRFFDTVEAMESFEGSIEVVSTIPFSAVALKSEGPLLTTLPVIPLP